MANEQPPIVLVDDEDFILKASRMTLLSNGFTRIETIRDSRELLPFLEKNEVAVVVLDLFMPHLSGLELLPQVVSRFPGLPVIVMTAVDETETAVNCMKAGAFDYLVKPVEGGRLTATVTKALEMRSLSTELSSLRDALFTDEVQNPEAFSEIVTASRKMRVVFQYVEVVAASRQPVLIYGETGVGKELIARSIHQLNRGGGQFVAVNVAGLDDNMFSDTLFGHRRGAFTGADQAREGLIARAAGGTLFLDEIGDLNEMSQIKLLRLIQEREYYPVGSDMAKKCDARIVCATNKPLTKLIEEGKFRRDLYYRLCAHQVKIPPLRERTEDIPVLLEHFLGTASATMGKKKPTPPPELSILLSAYHFPGNVRELEALVQDAVARHASGVLSMESFRDAIGDDRGTTRSGDRTEGASLQEFFGRFPTIREVEERLIAEAMKISRGNQGIAADMLGMTRPTLNKRLRGGRVG